MAKMYGSDNVKGLYERSMNLEVKMMSIVEAPFSISSVGKRSNEV